MSGYFCSSRRLYGLVAAVGLSVSCALPAPAADLYKPGNFPALVADRHADRVGDSLTIVINENSTATNSAQKNSSRATNVGGQITAGSSLNQSLQLGLNGSYDGSGQTGRADKMIAQISVVVDQVLPNGDLHVTGDQSLSINGDRTRIKLKGRVRIADISTTNSVNSNNLADAVIDYDGKGFVASSTKPGVVTRIFNWLGLL
jgi:flagellar L-ring protein precursor FlgH